MIYKEARVEARTPPAPPALLPFLTMPFFTFSKKESRSFVSFLKKQKKDNAKKDKPTHPKKHEKEARERSTRRCRKKRGAEKRQASPHSKTTLHNFQSIICQIPPHFLNIFGI